MGKIRLFELVKLKKFIRINKGFLKELIDQWEIEKKEDLELNEFRDRINILSAQWHQQWEPTTDYALSFSKVVAIHTQSLWNKQNEVSSEEIIDDQLKSVNQRFAKEIVSLNDSLQTERTTLADKLNKQVDKVENLKKGLNINQKFRFINDLYGGDTAEFNQVLDMVDQCNSYREAMEILDNNSSLRNQWDMKGQAFREFMEVVSKRFNEPGPAYGEHPFSAE
jgi:DNA-binding ferritin-like protein (Dps family)